MSRAGLDIITGPIGRVGGTVPYILGLARYSRYHPTLLRYSSFSAFSPRYRGIAYTLVRHPVWAQLDPYTLLFKLVRLRRYDILHTHGHPVWAGLYLGPRANSLHRIHTVHQLYRPTDFWAERQWRSFRELDSLMISYCRSADAVTTVSEYGRKRLLETCGIEAKVIRPAVDPRELEMASAERAITRWGLRSGFCLYAGGASPQKGLSSVLQLARSVQERDFVVVGSGTSPTDLLRNNSGVPDNVRGLGFLSRPQFMDCLAAAGVLLVPSGSEMLSTLLLEGMTFGKAIVAARIPSSKEVIEDGVTGYLFDPNDVDQFEAKVMKALEDRQIGPRARMRAQREHSWTTRAAEFDALYREVA